MIEVCDDTIQTLRSFFLDECSTSFDVSRNFYCYNTWNEHLLQFLVLLLFLFAIICCT